MTTHLGSTGLGIYIDSSNIQYTINQQVVLDIDKDTSSLTLQSLKLTGIPAPTGVSDAVPKEYVDNTPFIQLYATTVPSIDSPLTSHWTSIQANGLAFANNQISLPIGIYRLQLKVIADDGTMALGLCKGNSSTFLMSQTQYHQSLGTQTLEFVHQVTSQEAFNVFVLHKANSPNIHQTIQLIVYRI